jgi:transposase InsO family protein
MHRTRQSYYKALKSSAKHSVDQCSVLKLVQPIRHVMPRIGGKKLYHVLADQLLQNRIKIGRDKFFRLLKMNDLLIRPKKRYVSTTQSHHRFWVYDNLAKDLWLNKPNQLWVSDITYLKTYEGFCYLALITDAHSRKIVGFDVSDSLELNGCIRALKSALQTASDLGQLVHHSDRGIQYCSRQYIDLLKQKGIRVSMAAKGDCYENALAERVNGILKDEFNLDIKFKTKQQAMEAVRQSVYIYNRHRPHWSLNLKTPEQCHQVN